MNYPIISPVVSPLGALVHLGAMERSFSLALDAFSSTATGLTIPEIGSQWRTIQQVVLNPTTGRTFASSARRLMDGSGSLAQAYREYESRLSPDTTTRFGVGRSDDEMRRVDLQRQRELFQEMKRAPVASTRVSMSSALQLTWHLVVNRASSGAVFVNEDGRAIHLSNLYADSVLLGYGWYGSAMHYIEVSPASPTGRSRALFLRDQEFRAGPTAVWFATLVRSFSIFYSPQTSPLSGKFRLLGQDREKAKFETPVDLTNSAALIDIFNKLDPNGPFTLESDELVSGRRGGSMSAVYETVPLASVRHAMEEGQRTLYRTYYLPERSNNPAESAIPQEFRKRLGFPRKIP